MRLLRQQRKPACLRAVKRSIVGCIEEIRVILAKTTSSKPPASQPQPRRRRRVKKVTFKAQRPKFLKHFNLDTMKCVQMASDLASCVIHSGYVEQFDPIAKRRSRTFLLIRLTASCGPSKCAPVQHQPGLASQLSLILNQSQLNLSAHLELSRHNRSLSSL